MTVLTAMPTWLSDVVALNNHTAMPNWLVTLREQHWQAFVQQGVPTSKNERWKYSDTAFISQRKTVAEKNLHDEQIKEQINRHRMQDSESILLVMVNGYFAPALSDLQRLPQEIIGCSINTAWQQHEAILKQYMLSTEAIKNHSFANLNISLFADGLFLRIPENCHLTTPIHILSIATDANAFVAQPHHLFILEKNSQMVLLEENMAMTSSAYFMNTVTTIHAAANSQLQHTKIQREHVAATHLANTFIFQQQDSQVSLANFSVGANFSRDDVMVKLQKPGAHCQTAGFYRLSHDGQYIDHHLDIDHAAPHSHSAMLYKGVLDKKSRAVFNGRVHVGEGAQKIAAEQQNHNLLLSNQAEVYSKPELEIYSDDVKCKHGATTGQLDQDALFYFRARGIEKADAVAMLLQAFAAEVLQQVNHVSIRAHIENLVQNT